MYRGHIEGQLWRFLRRLSIGMSQRDRCYGGHNCKRRQTYPNPSVFWVIGTIQQFIARTIYYQKTPGANCPKSLVFRNYSGLELIQCWRQAERDARRGFFACVVDCTKIDSG